MTSNAPKPGSREADSSVGPPLRDPRLDTDADEFDHAELEELEDDAERERQKDSSALVGLVALILVILLAGVGLYATVSNSSTPTTDPGVSRQVPAAPTP